jgi:hypothetical protein
MPDVPNLQDFVEIASLPNAPQRAAKHLGYAAQGAKGDTLETAMFLVNMLKRAPFSTTPDEYQFRKAMQQSLDKEGKIDLESFQDSLAEQTGQKGLQNSLAGQKWMQFFAAAQKWMQNKNDEIPEEARDSIAGQIGAILNPVDPLAWASFGGSKVTKLPKVAKLGKFALKTAAKRAAAKGAAKGSLGAYVHSHGAAALRGATDKEAHQTGMEAAPYGAALGGLLGGAVGKFKQSRIKAAQKLAERNPQIVEEMSNLLPKELANKFPEILSHDPRGKKLGDLLTRSSTTKKVALDVKTLSEKAEQALAKETLGHSALAEKLTATYDSKDKSSGKAYLPLWEKYNEVFGDSKKPVVDKDIYTLWSKIGKKDSKELLAEAPTYEKLFFHGKGLDSKLKRIDDAISSGIEADKIHQSKITKNKLLKQRKVVNDVLKGMLDDDLTKKGDLDYAKDFGALKKSRLMQDILDTHKGRTHSPPLSGFFKKESEGLFDFLRAIPENDIEDIYKTALSDGVNKKIPDFLKDFVSPKTFTRLKAMEGLKEVGNFYAETAGKAKPKTGARTKGFRSMMAGAYASAKKVPSVREENTFVYGPSKLRSQDPTRMEFFEERRDFEKTQPPSKPPLEQLMTEQQQKQIIKKETMPYLRELGIAGYEYLDNPSSKNAKRAADKKFAYEDAKKKVTEGIKIQQEALEASNQEAKYKHMLSAKGYQKQADIVSKKPPAESTLIQRALKEKLLDKTHSPTNSFVKQLLEVSPGDDAIAVLKELTGTKNIRKAEKFISSLDTLPLKHSHSYLKRLSLVRAFAEQLLLDPNDKAAEAELKKLLRIKNPMAVHVLVRNLSLLEYYMSLKERG